MLAGSDIGLLTSHEEGFSNAVLEAMASGLPMVVTDVGGNAEVVEDGLSGFVVEPHNPEKLGEAILKLANDSELRQKMGQRSRTTIENKFTLTECVNQYHRLYETLLSEKSVKDWKNNT